MHIMHVPPNRDPQSRPNLDFGGAHFGTRPFSPEEESAAKQVYVFLCRRDGYSPERKLTQHATRARTNESPRLPGSLGALALEARRIVDQTFDSHPALLSLFSSLDDPEFHLKRGLSRHRLPTYVPLTV